MGIVSDVPETGIRIEVERPRDGGPPWQYAGAVITPDASFAVSATVSAEGDVAVELAANAPEGLAQRARLLLRSAWKHARADDTAPPRRVVRWRADWLLAPLILVMAIATSACEPPPKTALGYTESAKRAYDAAMQDFNAHSWIEAQTLMREVKRRYSYSKYARLAELRIADADFEQEKYADAVREYKDFIRAHRSEDDEVAYARSRIAEATYAEIPESFLMPAAEERDQASVVDAYKQLKSFLADYPNSKQSPHMRELLEQVTARLVHHELYVARFYLAKDNFDAAVARIEYALRNYSTPATGAPGEAATGNLMSEALLLLGQTYLKMHKWQSARQAFETILHDDDRSPIAVQARGYLDYLRQRGV
ncbi:MAG TPA: outer membrane protein assembly factor BamD [Polyangiaceae bacterium]|jgi:outer membrane protein assembly factor BamD|nr:outer membrane protein assembly factor BamD [Polyangiaceae bacterium]